MNEVIRTMMERRSCRSFDQTRQIADADLQDLLTAGLWAANGRGRQNTLLIAVQNREDADALRRMNAEILGSNFDPYYGAPTIILVLSKEDPDYHTPVEDGALVMGNLMNAAQSLGLGSIWIHREKEMFETEEGRALLKKWGVTGEWRGVGGCAVGFPAEDPGEGAARKEGRTIVVR